MIEYCENLNVFFQNKINSIKEDKNITIPYNVENYLVSLLENLNIEVVKSSIVEMQLEAKEKAEPRIYQKIGDKALATIALFERYLVYNNISESYIENVGITSYKLAGFLTLNKKAKLYIDLSDNFNQCTDILKYLREETTLGLPKDPVELFQYYNKTKSKEAYTKLQSLGLFAITQKIEA